MMTEQTNAKSPLFRLFSIVRIMAVLVVLTLANPVQVLADSVAFIPGTEDIPLMPALVPLEDGTMRFDTPTGRVVESLAQSRAGQSLSPQSLSDFYNQILPGLGWKTDGTGFTRSGERLEIKIWPKSDSSKSELGTFDSGTLDSGTFDSGTFDSGKSESTASTSGSPTDIIVRFLLSPE